MGLTEILKKSSDYFTGYYTAREAAYLESILKITAPKEIRFSDEGEPKINVHLKLMKSIRRNKYLKILSSCAAATLILGFRDRAEPYYFAGFFMMLNGILSLTNGNYLRSTREICDTFMNNSEDENYDGEEWKRGTEYGFSDDL